MFDKVNGSKEVRTRFLRRHRVEDMRDFWKKDENSFSGAKSKYHLYD